MVLIAGGVFGFIKYHQASGQLAELRQTEADRTAAAQLARDYAMKSLTYSFQDPDAFFRSVEDGVSQQLKDKYVNATDLLKAVMLQAQVSSTGEVLATDPVLAPDGSYEVVVSAHQTTRNLQNPTPKVSIILLRVTVNKVGNAWQVTDIGPKTGTKAPEEQQIPGARASCGSARSRRSPRSGARRRSGTCSRACSCTGSGQTGTASVNRLSLLVAVVTMAIASTVSPAARSRTPRCRPCPQSNPVITPTGTSPMVDCALHSGDLDFAVKYWSVPELPAAEGRESHRDRSVGRGGADDR